MDVEVGDVAVTGTVVAASYQPGKRTLDVSMTAGDLRAANPDLAKWVRVWSPRSDGSRGFALAGSVRALQRESDDLWRITLGELAAFDDKIVGGLGVRNCTPGEIFYSLARDIGFPAERLDVDGLSTAEEKFLVAVPVEGVAPMADIDANRVGITRDANVPKRFAGLGPDDLQASFAAPGMWAVTVVTAARVWDAEREAVHRFERILGRLTLAARYTMAVGPNGELRPFSGSAGRDEPRLRPIAGVEGARSKRIWLRGYTTVAPTTAVDPHVIEGFSEILGTPDERLDEAIAAWRRAQVATDSSVAAVALAEALEFYAAGTDVPDLFTKAQIRAMTRAARAALGPIDAARRERVSSRLGQLNEPPAAVLLRAAIQADDAPCTDKEFELIRRIREVRSRVLHGDSRPSLGVDDLREGTALVARLLAFRLKRLATESHARPGRGESESARPR